METGITRNAIISELSRSPHGKLQEYLPVGVRAANSEAEFFSHLIAWNQIHGQVRDSKVALPVISLTVGCSFHKEFEENALAHLALLDLRNLVRAFRFALETNSQKPRYMVQIKKLIERKLRFLEGNWSKWTRTAVQHRASLKTLYAICHLKPAPMADAILFKGERPKGSVFESIANLKNMSNTEAAGTIMERRIPFLIAMGALGVKAKEPDLVLALIERMSPTELVNNSKMLERLGIKTVPALRAAYEQALGRAGSSKKTTFKATTAAAAVAEEDEDSGIASKLRDLQEKQIKALGGIDGNWLVLGDKSGSMEHSIEVSRHLAGTLAKMVKGQVHLVFFDTQPTYTDATGKSYEEILAGTKHVNAGGGTSIGCGLLALAEKKIEVDGIAIVSDGGENSTPPFAHTYKAYCQSIGKDIPVYLYRTRGEPDVFSRNMQAAGIDLQVFDMTGGIDYYSLPNICKTMRTQRYSLADEVMATKLLTLEDIFEGKEAKTHA